MHEIILYRNREINVLAKTVSMIQVDFTHCIKKNLNLVKSLNGKARNPTGFRQWVVHELIMCTRENIWRDYKREKGRFHIVRYIQKVN